MSAICGIYTKNETVEKYHPQSMFEYFNRFTFNKSKSMCLNSIFFGSNLNHSTSESYFESMPFHDEESSLVITADAIIDNRDELFELLGIPPDMSIPDSYLILAAYKKWGTDCSSKLLGDFAFAIWDITKELLFCSRDQLGKRTLYYYHSQDFFAFSTLINPFFELKNIKKELNENFLADFLYFATAEPVRDCSVTVYKNITLLRPGHSILLTKSGIKIWEYWKIVQNTICHNKSDIEYENEFLKVFSDAVNCRLRCSKKIGIMLSGGLDSGAIASIAAKELSKTGQKLYSFTQVPISDYKNDLPKNQIANEQPYVENLCTYYNNISPSFVPSDGNSSLSEIDILLDILEQPYKNFHNFHWINEIHRMASAQNVGIILDGQSGNASVSSGSYNSYIFDLFKQKKIKTLVNEVITHAKFNKRPVFRTILSAVYNLSPYQIKKIIYKVRGGKNPYTLLSIINQDFGTKMNVKAKIDDAYFIKSQNSFNSRMMLLGPGASSHFGVIDTKLSIAFGIEKRDPTRDKRVVEFCINVPGNQWVRNGLERRLIRVATKDILPDMIRLNTTVRGKQAADWLQRLIPDWKSACTEIARIGEFDLEQKYLNVSKIKKVLNRNLVINAADVNNLEIILLIRSLIFSRFLRKNFGDSIK